MFDGSSPPRDDLVRDPPRDRGRLSGASTGEDHDGTSDRRNGARLFRVQTLEDPLLEQKALVDSSR
jgi:hypothetical protein